MTSRRAQLVIDTQQKNSPAFFLSPAIDPVAHCICENHNSSSRGIDGGDDGAPIADENQSRPSPVVTAIVGNYRTYARWRKAQQKLLLQALAVCRAWSEGDKAAAQKLFAAIQSGDDSRPDVALQLAPYLMAMAEFEKRLRPVEKNLRALVRQTPYWPWVKTVRGFGEFNLAKIIGEAHAIERYRNPSSLWKRMGLAVIDGERQRRVANDPELAIRHGYNAERRAVVYLLGECLIKANSPYRQVYDERRSNTALRTDWTPKHSHNDALRIMTKRVLRDLWVHSTNGGAP